VKDFIYELYANENFPIYLGVVILVLLVAFFIVFFLGRKDKKKIEQTQKLEAIKADAFKEVSAPAPVSVPTEPVAPVVSQVEPTPAVTITETPVAPAPVVESVPVVESAAPVAPEVPVAPVVEPAPVEIPVVPASAPEEKIPAYVPKPVEKIDPDTYKSPQTIDRLIDEKPVPEFNPDPVIEPYIPPEVNLENFNNLSTSINNELNELEKQQQIAKPIIEAATVEQTPEIIPVIAPVIEPAAPVVEPAPIIEPVVPVTPALEETPELTPSIESEVTPPLTVEPPVNPTKVMTDVFSSVYVPKKEEVEMEDTMAIELPKLKTSPVLEEEGEEKLKI